MNKPKVLIVEDDKYIQKAMRIQFENAGYVVHATPDVDSALDVLEESIPSAIILDIILPKTSGFELLKIIKENPKWKGIPVVIATNLDSDNERNLAIDLSAADFIVKSDLSLSNLVMQTTDFINKSAHARNLLK